VRPTGGTQRKGKKTKSIKYIRGNTLEREHDFRRRDCRESVTQNNDRHGLINVIITQIKSTFGGLPIFQSSLCGHQIGL
jgi:hypothetical protein